MLHSPGHIFEKIRDIPYHMGCFRGDASSQNCLTKNVQLAVELEKRGIATRGRIMEMDWHDTPIPEDIIALFPADVPPTHYFLEIDDGGGWRMVDASWDKALAKVGFPIADFKGNNTPALRPLRVFGLEEQTEYLERWSDPAVVDDFYQKAQPFIHATNAWLERARL